MSEKTPQAGVKCKMEEPVETPEETLEDFRIKNLIKREVKQHITEFRQEYSLEMDAFIKKTEEFEADIKLRMTQLFENTEFMDGLKKTMLRAITQEVNSRFSEDKLRETITDISLDQIQNNIQEFIQTVVEEVVTKFVDRLKAQQHIAKTLAYSCDVAIKSVVRDGSLDFENRAMKIIKETLRDMTTQTMKDTLAQQTKQQIENKGETKDN